MKLEIMRNMGLRWTVYRTQYEIKKKFGYLERAYKPINLADINIGEGINKSFVRKTFRENLSQLNIENVINRSDKEKLISRAESILDSEFYYFNYKKINFKGWNYSPKTQHFAPSGIHWSKISDFNSNFGDIKWIWELNRFNFAYDLTRAYIYSKNSIFVEKFWQLFEDFLENNPLEIGVNYKCSQEMSFRTNAWIFALYHFIDHPATSEERITTMLKCISHYADHIHKHINFSVEAVKNNHSISEATTLTVIGNTFDFFPSSKKLYKKGRKILEKEISWQIKKDGTFIQHSHNYHRLVLQNLSWYITSTLSVDKQISSVVAEKAQLSINYFLNVISDLGEVPNYGMNDGSYIFPLTERSYQDYRPVLQCLNYQLNKQILFDDEYVNEILSLLNPIGINDNHSLNKVKDNKSLIINSYGGYHILKKGQFKVFIKSKTYKDRPVQADMNHVDIWYGNQCIFGDAGTYSYNDEDKILDYFNGTFSHNTVLINDKNQMTKGSRFIWFNWSKSNTPQVYYAQDKIIIKVELLNYNQYRHIRKISLSEDNIIIEDEIVNDKELDTDIKLQWLTELDATQKDDFVKINNSEWKLDMISELNGEIKIYSGNHDEFRGWFSSTYGEKHPANQIVYHVESNRKNIRIKSIITKG